MATIEDPDAELVARAGKGDSRAAEALIRRHLPMLMGLAQRMLGHAGEAEDVVQESFLRLWKQAANWRPGGAKFSTWLYRVALNQCYDRLRRKPIQGLDAAGDIQDSAPDPESALVASGLSARVTKAIAELPVRQRAAIVLCHLEDCGNIEAAEILGISVEALESLLARGRRALRERLKDLKA